MLIDKKTHLIYKIIAFNVKNKYIYIKSSIMDTYKFEGGEISLIEHNILLIEYPTTQLITKEIIFNLRSLRENLLGSQPFYTITDARNGQLKLSNEAKNFISSENRSSTQRCGNAILVNTLAKKIKIELYILFNKPQVKTKIFTELNKALCWINTMQSENNLNFNTSEINYAKHY